MVMLKSHHQLMWTFTSKLIHCFARPVFIYLVSLSLTLQLFFAAIFFQVESGTNREVATFFDALYFTVTIMTGVGLGDIHPVTVWGKLVSMLMMLSGTVIFVTFTAVLAVFVLEIESEHIKKK